MIWYTATCKSAGSTDVEQSIETTYSWGKGEKWSFRTVCPGNFTNSLKWKAASSAAVLATNAAAIAVKKNFIWWLSSALVIWGATEQSARMASKMKYKKQSTSSWLSCVLCHRCKSRADAWIQIPTQRKILEWVVGNVCWPPRLFKGRSAVCYFNTL